MKSALIVAERATFPVRRLCRLIGVAASAFYAWLRREREGGPSKRLQDEASLVAEIREIL
jgi:transposase-like protein